MKTEIGELKKQIEAKNKTLQRYIRSIRYTWTESTLEDLVDRLGKSHMKQDRKVQTLFFPHLSQQGINRYYLKLSTNYDHFSFIENIQIALKHIKSCQPHSYKRNVN